MEDPANPGNYLKMTRAERRQAMRAKVNKRRVVTEEELDTAQEEVLDLFAKWRTTIKYRYSWMEKLKRFVGMKVPELQPNGDIYFLGLLQDKVDEVDRPIAVQYEDIFGNPRTVIFNPKRLRDMEKAAGKEGIFNRLELRDHRAVV
jgi:hypothetical protein